jgi:O-acetylhomoserine (thiol)-lyase
MRTLGPTLSPLAAFLLLQGIETLHVRMPRHCESALAIAEHLAGIRGLRGSIIRC